MNDKHLLEGIISDYYNSIQDSFFYRKKNFWKYDLITTFFSISLLILILNIVPIIPAIDIEYYLWIYNKIKLIFNIKGSEFSFFIKWFVGVTFWLLIVGLFAIFYKFWSLKIKRKFVKSIDISFCYAFTLRKEIKNYIINDNITHLDNISNYFEKIYTDLILTPFYYDNATNSKKIPLDIVRENLIKKYPWIKFSEESNYLIDSFKSMKSKIKKRIDFKIELEDVLPFLDYLVLYEFSIIKPNQKNDEKIELKDQRFTYLLKMQEELNKLDGYEGISTNEQTKKKKFTEIFNYIIALFTSSNILTMFLAWLILLTLIFVTSSIIIIKKVNLEIDSTVLIGLLTAPFLGAITLVATIYTKNKN